VDAQREEMQARQKQLELQQQAELAQLNARYAAEADQRKLEFEQWKASLDASVKLEIANKSAQTSMDTAQLAKQPDTRVDQLLQMIQALEQSANEPAELVRDETGRAVAVRRGSKTRKIVRGPDGRAIGVQ
jgi:CTP:molybdopterin cytidylyltransferase MocA